MKNKLEINGSYLSQQEIRRSVRYNLKLKLYSFYLLIIFLTVLYRTDSGYLFVVVCIWINSGYIKVWQYKIRCAMSRALLVFLTAAMLCEGSVVFYIRVYHIALQAFAILFLSSRTIESEHQLISPSASPALGTSLRMKCSLLQCQSLRMVEQ